MILKKAFKYKLRPTRKQEQFFFQFAGAARWVYNRGLQERREAWEKRKECLSNYQQNKELTQLKKEPDTSWLKTIHSQVLQQSLGDLHQTYQNFFRRLKNGEDPGDIHFRCKGVHDSFRYPQGVKVSGSYVFLPKIGKVRFRKSRDIYGTIKQTTILYERGGWYVCFSVEWQQEFEKKPEHSSVIGIDLGLESFAIIGSEIGIEKVANPRFLNKQLSHLRYLSRQVSKKKKKGQNRKKAVIALRNFHAKLQAKRQDFLHKLSTAIIKSHDVIVVESLKVKRLLQKSVKALARSISDAGWRSFLQQLKYKCEHAGKRFLEAGEWFPSTKQCSRCKKRNDIKLNERIYRCSCGLEIHRDDNSAINLRAVGTTVLKACGAAPVKGSDEARIPRL